MDRVVSKASSYLITGTILLAVLYVGQVVFIPMFFGLFIAMVLYPGCKYLENKHWPRSLAVAVGLSAVLLLFSVLVWVLFWQLQAFAYDLPRMREQLSTAVLQMQQWIQASMHIPLEAQETWLAQQEKGMDGNLLSFVQSGIGETGKVLFMLLIAPVFAALFLYNRENFVHFLYLSLRNTNVNLAEILQQTIHTYYRFIKGMVGVYIIVGVLNSIGLLALGIEHAILFGMITAVMTIIPYIGIVLSAAVPVSIAWITTGSFWLPLGVITVFGIVQYLEAYIIFPKIVGTQLKLNTWSVLVAALIGGIVWGVAGMILFIPFVGVLKIISGQVEEWKPLNVLLTSSQAKPQLAHKPLKKPKIKSTFSA